MNIKQVNYWLIIILSFSSSEVFAQHSLPVNLMSYNIRLDHTGDNEDNWKHRKGDMVKYLQSNQADFIGLQEAQHHQLHYLDSLLTDYAYLGVGRDDGVQGGEYSPILYSKSKWKVIESNTFWLSPTPLRVSRGWDAACHRICTYGLFQNQSNQKILVINTHFDHKGKEARKNSLPLIEEFVANYPDVNTVLMGDLNFEPSSPLYQSIPKAFSDAYSLMSTSKEEATYNGFKADEFANRRIDYILINEPSKILQYKVDRPKTQNSRQLSDHYPIQILIDL